ncbi:MAG: Rieske 2Fe-2S domain-containing protein [Actinobacteria bacterium]|nr:Rieske 2Fe-2S domain-containing protein [Actinomycetota bacterium]
MQPTHNDEHPHVPGPSIWPAGFAVGVVVLLVGLIVSWYVVGLGALIALAFGFLWVRDLTTGSSLTEAPAVAPEGGRSESATGAAIPADRGEAAAVPGDRYPRSKFLELSTLGLGGVIGGLVSAPAIGFMVAPAFLKQGVKDHDIGPITDYPEGKFVVATYMSDANQGEVSRRTAFVRNNGQLNGQPSFTIISNHCAHLGCPVQPNGPLDTPNGKQYHDVSLIPTISIAGFGCPCHGGQYDTEGNRTSGPPVRALDRYSFSIRNGNLFVGKPYSVSHVDGAGSGAKIHKWTLAFPGEHVNGIESWLYPIQPPH